MCHHARLTTMPNSTCEGLYSLTMFPKNVFLKVAGWTTISLFLAGGLLTSCSSNSSTTSVVLTPAAAEGQKLASASGCASCHGSNGEGQVGPSYIGLADSQVTLSDGTIVTADDSYLYTSIKNPNAMKRKGAVGQMPSNQLTDEEIASIIVYIRALK